MHLGPNFWPVNRSKPLVRGNQVSDHVASGSTSLNALMGKTVASDPIARGASLSEQRGCWAQTPIVLEAQMHKYVDSPYRKLDPVRKNDVKQSSRSESLGL